MTQSTGQQFEGLLAAALFVVAVIFVGGGCTPSRGNDAPSKSSEASEQHSEAAKVDQRDEAVACEANSDCAACPTETGCGCVPSRTTAGCPPQLDSCMADPCQWSEAVCGMGRCALTPPNGPCNTDDDCESRRHPYRCSYIAVRKSAPRADTRSGMGCGGLPKPPETRCEPQQHRCVIVEAGARARAQPPGERI